MEVLQRYIDLLVPGGTLYVFTNSIFVRHDHPVFGELTLPFAYWIVTQNIPGLEFRLGDHLIFSIKKTAQRVRLPEMKVDQFDETTIPFRKRLAAPATNPSGRIEFKPILEN